MKRTSTPTTRDSQLMKTALRIATLRTRRKVVKAELKEIDEEIKTRTKELKALSQEMTDVPVGGSPPMRVFGER